MKSICKIRRQFVLTGEFIVCISCLQAEFWEIPKTFLFEVPACLSLTQQFALKSLLIERLALEKTTICVVSQFLRHQCSLPCWLAIFWICKLIHSEGSKLGKTLKNVDEEGHC